MPSSAKSKRKTTKKAPAKKSPARSRKSPAKKATTKKKTTKKSPAKKTKASAATKAKPAAKKSSRAGASKMATTTTKKKTTKKTTKKTGSVKSKSAAGAQTKKTTSKKAPSKKTTAKSSKSTTKPAKSTKAKETKAKSDPKKPPEPRFRTFFSSNNDGAAAAKKLAAAAGLTKLKDEGRRIAAEPAAKRLTKSPFTKRQRDHYKEILLLKRAQLVGDVTNMETEALTGGGSGSLSSLPQHMADAGSDTYDQSLNLDLAAGQRKLLKEIDDALVRIAENTFGICEYLGTPISTERLENTPWARYSIEGAREMEHQGLL